MACTGSDSAVKGRMKMKSAMLEFAASVFSRNGWVNGRLLGLTRQFAVLALLLIVVAPEPAHAFGLPGKKKPDAAADKSKATPPEEALKSYIQRVRTQHDTEVDRKSVV